MRQGLLLISGVAALATQANPIRKVVTLLQDMQKEIEAEGEKEEELYKKFMCFCTGNTDNLSKEAEEAAARIEELKATQKADEAEKEQLTQDLIQHKKDRATAQQDLATATEIRKKEHNVYVKEAGETKDNIDAVNAAIPALEKGMGSFLQTTAASNLKKVISNFGDMTEATDRETILAFLSEDKDYAPQSGQIVGILKNMKDEMDKSLGGIVGEEEAAAKNFLELKAAKEKEISAAGQAIESKMQRSGKLAVAIVEAKNAIEDSTSELNDAQKFMAELSVACKEKTADMEERTKTRQEEISAISEAISVLNDDDALDLFKQTLPSPKTPGVGFLQLQHKGNNLKKVRDLVTSAAEQYKANPALNLLAHTLVSRIHSAEQVLSAEGAGKVDFSTVLKMIDDMVTLLKKEQADDEKHRDWCNQEFDTSDDEKKETTRKLGDTESTIAELQDSIAQLKEQITNTNGKIVDLDKSVASATEQRKQEHAEYTQTMQLTEAAVQLIFKAKNRLAKFYNPGQYVAPKERELSREEEIYAGAGGEVDRSAPAKQIYGTTQTVFLQTKSKASPPVPPETFGAYQNKGQKGNSVVALMDMLSKELEKDAQEAEHGEKTAQKEYAELMADAQETRAQDVKTVQTSEKTKAGLEGNLEESKTQRIMTNEALNQVGSYIQDLHQSCDFVMANFELRRQARTSESESLSNAKAVLSGASFE